MSTDTGMSLNEVFSMPARISRALAFEFLGFWGFVFWGFFLEDLHIH